MDIDINAVITTGTVISGAMPCINAASDPGTLQQQQQQCVGEYTTNPPPQQNPVGQKPLR